MIFVNIDQADSTTPLTQEELVLLVATSTANPVLLKGQSQEHHFPLRNAMRIAVKEG